MHLTKETTFSYLLLNLQCPFPYEDETDTIEFSRSVFSITFKEKSI